MEEPSLVEKEAILLRWRSQHPEAPAGALPSEEESAQLLVEIRERVAGIESETLNMLSRSMRVRPTGGGTPMARFVALLFFWPLAIAGVVYLIWLVIRFL